MALLSKSESWRRAVIWAWSNLTKRAAGAGFIRAEVRSCTAAMAISADNSAGMRLP